MNKLSELPILGIISTLYGSAIKNLHYNLYPLCSSIITFIHSFKAIPTYTKSIFLISHVATNAWKCKFTHVIYFEFHYYATK